MTAEHAKMLAEITKIGETGPKAADAALQSLRRARKAEVSEAEAPSDLESFGHRLGDLEVGAGEIGGEVIEHLGELDAGAEEAVESAIAVAEAYENQPDKSTVTPLTVEIEKYRAKQPKRGGARPAACEEFGVDPTDPLAVDKVKVAGRLKTDGLKLADLETFRPGYWELPYQTRGKDDKGKSSPSRLLVLSDFLYRWQDAKNAAEKEATRLKKRAAKIRAKRWSTDYYDLSPADQKRERDRVWRQNKRTS